MSDDLIRRSDAIEAVGKVDDYGDGIGFEVRSHCLVELELVPSADRPRGEWLDRAYCQVDEDAYEVAICSKCNAEITLEYPHDSYCPNCGARMKGADDD